MRSYSPVVYSPGQRHLELTRRYQEAFFKRVVKIKIKKTTCKLRVLMYVKLWQHLRFESLPNKVIMREKKLAKLLKFLE